jgi:predicted metal-dependent phosphoesterase TrpH
VLLTPERATPGFIAGALPPGKWLAQLAAHAILADAAACQYSLEIEIVAAVGEQLAETAWVPTQRVLDDTSKWYRGELHSHTIHSDGKHSPAELLELARGRGLDFLTITDHNTHSVFKALDQLQHDHLLVIPGIELTTFYGHALLLGVDRWIDWRTGYDNWTMEDAARQIHALGGLFILAHPHDIGSPFCTGCRWEYADFDMSLADGVEVWNGFWEASASKNPGGLELWQQLQAGERRFLATAGTDFHAADDWGAGSPSVYVYARDLSTAMVLQGLREGRLILSSGPWINLSVPGPHGAVYRVGDTCPAAAGSVQVEIEWADAPADAHLLIRSGQDVLEALPVTGRGAVRQGLSLSGSDRFWIELYAPDGTLLALTNPIFAQREG